MNPVTIHLWTLGITALVILYSDHEAFSYFRGKKQLLDKRKMELLHYVVWAGLLIMIASGLKLALPAWEYYISEPSFLIKMGFVLVLIVNGVFIGRLTPIASERPFSDLAARGRLSLLLSGSLSTMGWIGAAVIGFYFL